VKEQLFLCTWKPFASVVPRSWNELTEIDLLEKKESISCVLQARKFKSSWCSRCLINSHGNLNI
jgi:hypothetical protein